MTDPVCNSESLQDLVARLSDVLRFVFDQQREDIVVLVGDEGVNRALVSQLEEKAAPCFLGRDAVEQPDVLSGRTRIRRINETLHVVV
jgi:broad specificity phosphatase PhoE